jgi:hypothetical protein
MHDHSMPFFAHTRRREANIKNLSGKTIILDRNVNTLNVTAYMATLGYALNMFSSTRYMYYFGLIL